MENDDIDYRIAQMLHLYQVALDKGDPAAPGIFPTSTYYLPREPEATYQYGRFGNPSWDSVEDALGFLQQADVVAFPSGMAAIAAVLIPHARPGDRVLLPADGYYTTRQLAESYMRPMGVRIDLCPTKDYRHRDLHGYRLVLVETPSNPGLEICDINDVATRARAAGAISIADNTLMTPLGQRPLDLGIDIVVSSDTKAVNGHSDALFGHVATRSPILLQATRDWRKVTGAIPGPLTAWMVRRGLETLELRFARMCHNAQTIAENLCHHKAVQSVSYPGLRHHPGHDIAAEQMSAFGSVLGVTLADAESAELFIEESEFILPATSFGGLHTSAERRGRWGDDVPVGFIRLSVGCEPTAALWADMEHALDSLSSP